MDAFATQDTELDAEAALRLVDFWTPLTVRALLAAGIGDALAAGPLAVEDLASETGLQASALARALRAIAPTRLVTKQSDGRWALTTAGQVMRSDHPASLAGMGLRTWTVAAWAEVMHSLRTGEPAFPVAFGMRFFDWLSDHPQAREEFDRGMQQRLELVTAAIDLYPWPRQGTVVDIGGGTGELLTQILTLQRRLRGVLFDRPETVAEAAAVLRNAGVADRCAVVGGDFFTEVPDGAEVYVASNVLHDWPDEDAVRILESIGRAMPDDGRLVLLEGVVPSGEEPHHIKRLDMHMLVMFGSLERDELQWRQLLGRAGMELTTIYPGPVLSWLEGRCSRS